MKNYKMVLAYDGTRYNGWQKQGNTENTMQEKLERILQEISGAETEVFGSGRTDAGTHATGQVMNFHINWNGTAEQLLDAFNAKLPRISRRFPSRKCPSFPQQTQCKGEALFLFHLDWQAFACV